MNLKLSDFFKDRRKTRSVKVGRVIIGGDFPVAIQSMWKQPLNTIDEPLLAGIRELQAYGCDILRFAVPDTETAGILGRLATLTELPIVADIHFDYRLALQCLDFPLAKIRINPGNIGADWKVEEVIRKALDKGVAIRVGINSGSLPKELKGEDDISMAMLKAAEKELDLLVKYGFSDVVFSLKSSSIESTIKANLLFAEKYDYPLHLGITEAGPLLPGIVKSSIALSELLKLGLGDTVRVSLSDTPLNEVLTAREILKACRLNKPGIEIISCPTCGRTAFDVRRFLHEIMPFLQKQELSLTVAVMGCPVNGPGEAKHADLGITGTDKYAVIFKEGKIIRRVRSEEALDAFKEEIRACLGKISS